jgi:NADH-quinone oxidoreductase subunit M
LPATSGFVGEFLVVLASVKVNFWLGFAAATIMILGAAYTLWMYKRVIFGPVGNSGVASMRDLSRREFWMLGVVALAVLAMGIWPKPFIDVMHTSVVDLLARVAQSKT